MERKAIRPRAHGGTFLTHVTHDSRDLAQVALVEAGMPRREAAQAMKVLMVADKREAAEQEALRKRNRQARERIAQRATQEAELIKKG